MQVLIAFAVIIVPHDVLHTFCLVGDPFGSHIEADIVYNTNSCKLVLAKAAMVSQHGGFVFCRVHLLLNILNQGLMYLKKTDII